MIVFAYLCVEKKTRTTSKVTRLLLYPKKKNLEKKKVFPWQPHGNWDFNLRDCNFRVNYIKVLMIYWEKKGLKQILNKALSSRRNRPTVYANIWNLKKKQSLAKSCQEKAINYGGVQQFKFSYFFHCS